MPASGWEMIANVRLSDASCCVFAHVVTCFCDDCREGFCDDCCDDCREGFCDDCLDMFLAVVFSCSGSPCSELDL